MNVLPPNFWTKIELEFIFLHCVGWGLKFKLAKLHFNALSPGIENNKKITTELKTLQFLIRTLRDIAGQFKQKIASSESSRCVTITKTKTYEKRNETVFFLASEKQ